MDVNTILCVGRTNKFDLYSNVQKEQFIPSVSSFEFESVRASVRKDKRDSGTTLKRTSNSSDSPGKSILRGSIKERSPQGNRIVRFTDGSSKRDTNSEFLRLHINETTQTHVDQRLPREEKIVRVYSTADYKNAGKRDFSTLHSKSDFMMKAELKASSVSASSPRQAIRDAPNRNIRYTEYNENAYKLQRELPQTPCHCLDGKQRVQKVIGFCDHKQCRRKHMSKTNNDQDKGAVVKRSSTTQTPNIPSGEKILQNMDLGGMDSAPHHSLKELKRSQHTDGQKIIQNMELGKLQREKSIGVQTIESNYTKNIPTELAIDVQTSRDISVQTPQEKTISASKTEKFQTPPTKDLCTLNNTGVQTPRDAGVQTPRDVGVQTPRTIGVQTHDILECEDPISVSVQTSPFPNDNKIIPKMDITTHIWSTRQSSAVDSIQTSDDEKTNITPSLLSREDIDNRSKQRSPIPEFHDKIVTVSDDEEEVCIPSCLTGPFPQKEQIMIYDNLKGHKTIGERTWNSTCDSQMSPLTEYSAKQLLEQESIPVINIRHDTSPSKQTQVHQFRGFQKSMKTSSTNLGREQWKHQKNKILEKKNKDVWEAETKVNIVTQPKISPLIQTQRTADKTKVFPENLIFTPIETHSFDPDLLSLTNLDEAAVKEKLSKEHISRNSFIKSIDLGPGPADINDHYEKAPWYVPSRSRVVKRISFKDTPSERYAKGTTPNYVFFKKTNLGSKYETFEPFSGSNSNELYKSKSSSPTESVKSSSASADNRQSYSSTVQRKSFSSSKELTPMLSKIRKHAFRKNVTENVTGHYTQRQENQSEFTCQRSDTFLSSFNSNAKPFLMPLSSAAFSDIGNFESSGKQPPSLKDSSNYRPVPKQQAVSLPTKTLEDCTSFGYLEQTRKQSQPTASVSHMGARSRYSTPGKPPIPSRNTPNKDAVTALDPSKPYTYGICNQTEFHIKGSSQIYRKKDGFKTDIAEKSTPRHADKAVEGRRRSNNSDSGLGQDTSDPTQRLATDSVFLGNETIQKIIEQSSL